MSFMAIEPINAKTFDEIVPDKKMQIILLKGAIFIGVIVLAIFVMISKIFLYLKIETLKRENYGTIT